MEVKQDLKVVYVKMTCDKCGVGEMVREGKESLFSAPPQFRHVCNRCGHKATYFASYPNIRYEFPRFDGKIQVIHPSQYEYKGVCFDYAYDPETGEKGI